MLREHYVLFRRAHLLVDLAAVAACVAVCRQILEPTARSLSSPELLLVPAFLILLVILSITLAAGDRPYEYRLRKWPAVMRSVLWAWSIAVALTLAALFVVPSWMPNRVIFAASGAAGLLALVIIHSAVWLTLNLYRQSGRSYKNVLIVGTGDLACSTVDEILSHPGQGLRILGFLDWEIERRLWRYRDVPVVGTLADLPTIAKSRRIDTVIFAVGYRVLGKIAGGVRLCNRLGLAAIVLTDVLGDAPLRRTVGEFFGRPGVRFDTTHRSVWAVGAKSLFDRAAALAGLILCLPVFGVIALAIRRTSPGPVFFTQTRVGLNGRRFTLWKFRTMVREAEKKKAELAAFNEMSGPVFKMSDDPRVTRLGQFLRRTSLDELPQLINVLKGDMSLVGPRPPLPHEVVQYAGWERRRLSVKPGLTCLWQINGRNRIDFDEWMKLDLEYIDTWSLQKDAAILAKTVPAVLRGAGAR